MLSSSHALPRTASSFADTNRFDMWQEDKFHPLRRLTFHLTSSLLCLTLSALSLAAALNTSNELPVGVLLADKCCLPLRLAKLDQEAAFLIRCAPALLPRAEAAGTSTTGIICKSKNSVTMENNNNNYLPDSDIKVKHKSMYKLIE